MPTENATPRPAADLVFEQDTRYIPELDAPLEQDLPRPAAPERERDSSGRFVAPPPAAPAHAHDPAVVRLARDLQYSQAEIDATPPDVLREVVYEVNKRTISLLAEQRRQTGSGVQPQEQRPQLEPEPEPDLSFVDENIRRWMTQKEKKIAALEAELAGQKTEREIGSRDRQIDEAFAGLKNSKLFGDGAGNALPPTSAELARRRAVVAEAVQLPTGSWETRIKQAYARIYGGLTATEAEAGADAPSIYDDPRAPRGERSAPRATDRSVPPWLQQQRDQWDDAALATPTNRKPGPLSPDTRAALAVRSYLQEHDLGGLFGDGDREP